MNPNSSLSLLLESTASSFKLKQLHQIHGHLLASGHLLYPPHLYKLLILILSSNSSPSFLSYSRQISFNSPSPPSIFALNALIRAHSNPLSFPHSISLFRQILLSPFLSPDRFTFTFLVRSSSHLASLPAASASHAAALKHGHSADPHVLSALIRLYSAFPSPADPCRILYSAIPNPDAVTRTAMINALIASSQISHARNMFDEMPHRDAVAWNSMIAGYANSGMCREALELFSEMQAAVSANESTLVSVLTACAQLGASDHGRWAHAYIQRKGIPLTVNLGTALIDMYSKCGCAETASEVFEAMPERNVYTWSSAMSGLAMNGDGVRCVDLFDRMESEAEVEPNGITFVAVLRGCSVAGLVDRGTCYFDLMKRRYAIDPWPEHYGIMVDMYGRAGKLAEAMKFIEEMPFRPHAGVWGALLSACKIHRNVGLGELALSRILEIEATNDGAYVLLSNIYAESRNWTGVSGVRETMKAKGVRKQPGCSAIEVGGTVHEFFVGDRTHPMYAQIEAMLGEITCRLKLAGYAAKTDEVLFDIEEEEKEKALFWHSEKLAIAFGLVVLEEGAAIRVVKNLRVCWDCHVVSKLISKVFGREIVVRDRNRFHHFRNGVCSCHDYW